ncbi:hypothetical protein GZH47_31875 (plasmid) [Paenibacillus rhizovicinus]|uniref:Uncharacterized protein n=1 Tax=Paenibacillus rhizovicinus TaxID=2704463 RepID=A0A6C0PAU7_9BACL|nr:hypothetical protein [Paenibacillus rhizovicinus]QHW35495.1 hypothetical protein GZH47_31875 [Paenibacillus rhizovicinus]
MVNSLNGIFSPISEPKVKAPPSKAQKPVAPPSAPPKPQYRPEPPVAAAAPKNKARTRRERSDKKKDMKFPVTPEQREDLRKRASELRIADRKPEMKYETISNTAILKQALEHYAIFPERYPPLVYKDTGQYMHAELLLPDYVEVEALARKLNLSIRKTVYRLIMNYIYRGDVDIHAYRKSQQQ